MELILLLPFINNLVMSGIKWLLANSLSSEKTRNWRLRLTLIGLSLVGVVATAALNGNPIDGNTVTDLLSTALLTVGVAVASHFSYKVIAVDA